LFAVIGVIALFFGHHPDVGDPRPLARDAGGGRRDVRIFNIRRAACTSGAAEGPHGSVPFRGCLCRRHAAGGWRLPGQGRLRRCCAMVQGATLDMRAPQRAALLQTPGDSDSSGCRRSAGHMKPRGQDLVIKKSTDGNSSGARFLGSPAAPTHSA
jgi:hypothetical protein